MNARPAPAAARRQHRMPLRRLVRLLPAVLPALLAACATGYSPGSLKPGDSIDTAVRQMGQPTGEYPRADGSRRLEFARGPYGKHTYMLDFDAQGRLLQSSQVLTETTFASVQAGMTADQVRQTLGRPARVWGVRYHNQTVWSYRYDTPFCQLFHVGITPSGVVEDTSFGPDPACDVDDRRFPLMR
ncbi:MAG: outer membrane protein assembly factor BamE [Aquincola tertiaricarbonis]